MMNGVTGQCALLAACLLMSALPAQADTQVNYHGTLAHEPPCTFTDDGPIALSFGDVQISEVGVVPHEQYWVIGVECKSGSSVYIRHTGVATAFNTAAVQTNVADFGIELTIMDENNVYQRLPIDQLVKVDDDSTGRHGFPIKANLVKKSGVTLPVGEFSGVSTLQFEVP